MLSTSMPSGVSIGARRTWAGNSLPSLRRPEISAAMAMGRVEGLIMYALARPGVMLFGTVPDEQFHLLPKHFLAAVAEDPLGLGIDSADATLPVHYYDRSGRLFEELFQHRPRSLKFGLVRRFSVASRKTSTTPVQRPCSSRIGETESSMDTSRPSLLAGYSHPPLRRQLPRPTRGRRRLTPAGGSPHRPRGRRRLLPVPSRRRATSRSASQPRGSET